MKLIFWTFLQKKLWNRLYLLNQIVNSDWKWMSIYKWPLYDYFWPFFCHMYVHLSQNCGSEDHFEVLNRSYLWLVKKLWHKTQEFPFLFFSRFCTKTDICIFFVFYIFLFFVMTFVTIKIDQHLKMTVGISVLWKINI